MKPLDDIKKENPFKVPEGYFESLTDRVMASVEENRQPVTMVKEPGRSGIRLMPFFAMAAAIIGFAVIAAGMVRLVSRNDNNIFRGSDNEIYADVFTEEIDTYIIESEWSLPDETTTDEEALPSEAIIDYLLLENIELTDIYEIL